MTWAALIKCVYEVDPLKCPRCGGQMKVIGFIDESAVIGKILRNCGMPACRSLGAGRWKEPPMRAPPVVSHAPPVLAEPALDYGLLSLRSPM